MERWGLRWNLIAATMTATAAIVLTILLLEDPLSEVRMSRTVRAGLEGALNDAETRLAMDTDADRVAEETGADCGCVITIVQDGRVIGDSRYDAPDLQRAATPMIKLQDGQQEAFRRLPAGPDDDGYWTGVRRVDSSTVLYATQSLVQAEALRGGLRELMLVAGALALIIGVILTWALSRTIAAPAAQLTEVADALARGDLSVRTNSDREDELGDIGRSLDRLADQLTERIASLHAEENRLKTMLDSMVEAVFVTDARGRIVLTNTALDSIALGETLGRTPQETLRNDELRGAVRRARDGSPVAIDIKLERDGRRREYTAVAAPLPDNAGVVGVLHDVTRAKLADRVRRDFVANASHELRTPLTAIRGFAETLKGGAIKDPEAASKFVDVILKHTMRLQALVNDLVALSRAESPEQQYELTTVDLAQSVQDVVQGLEGQARQRGIHIEMKDMSHLPQVVANPRALDQVLVNLVDNAIKYTQGNGLISIRGATEDQWIVLEIENTGPGIPPDQLDRIFERFYRVDAGRSREMGGTGLGLSIVRHLVVRMGGHIEADSKVGEWTRFRLSLGEAGRAATRTLPPLAS